MFVLHLERNLFIMFFFQRFRVVNFLFFIIYSVSIFGLSLIYAFFSYDVHSDHHPISIFVFDGTECAQTDQV